jgi:hypothetical protein
MHREDLQQPDQPIQDQMPQHRVGEKGNHGNVKPAPEPLTPDYRIAPKHSKSSIEEL